MEDQTPPGFPVLARGHGLGWVKALQKLLLVDFSHLIARDLLHHDQLSWDGVWCHGLPATQKRSPLRLTDQRFQPLHPTEPDLRPHKRRRTREGFAPAPCVLQPVAVDNRAAPAVALQAAGLLVTGEWLWSDADRALALS